MYPGRYERFALYGPEDFQRYAQLLGIYRDDDIVRIFVTMFQLFKYYRFVGSIFTWTLRRNVIFCENILDFQSLLSFVPSELP